MTFPITPFYRPEHRPNPVIGVLKHRENKRLQIAAFFSENLGRRFSSRILHNTFGSSLRTRISEINLNEYEVTDLVIKNVTTFEGSREVSIYWAEIDPDKVRRLAEVEERRPQ
jgi:hypothetical protein